VSSYFGQLAVSRHLISGIDCATAGAATADVARPSPAAFRNSRRFMIFPLGPDGQVCRQGRMINSHPVRKKRAAEKMDNDVWLAGADGCAGGWMLALVRVAGDDVRLRVVPSFAAIATAPEAPATIAVDMPIGLPARIGPLGRGPERAVRPLLGARQSSVFPVPSRQAVYAPSYPDACRIALATSDPPRSVQKQLFLIAPRIREIDGLLRADGALAARVFEVHPELAFWRLNGERPLAFPKKVKPGLALRRKLLIAAGFPRAAVAAPPPKGAGADDVLDALACAAIARRIHAGVAKPFPDAPARDDYGLPMVIWA
jgi:predicted RNase H-like nuclease